MVQTLRIFIGLSIALLALSACGKKSVLVNAPTAPQEIGLATPTPNPFPSALPTPFVQPPLVHEEIIPNPASPALFCRPGSSNYSFAYCFNWLVRQKDAYPEESWRIVIAPGYHTLKDNLLLFDVKNLEVAGANDSSGTPPALHSDGLPANRLQYQYFTFLVINSKNVQIRNLQLFGENLSAQRGIGICALTGSRTEGISLKNLQFSDYRGSNVIAGNAISGASLTDISGYLLTGNPIYKFGELLKGIPPPQRFCGGDLKSIAFTQSLVRTKSVGFYLVPPTASLSSNIFISPPTFPAVAAPAWYAAKDALAAHFSEIEVSDNRFVNAASTATEVRDNAFHSVMKLHNATNVRVLRNEIDLSTLPKDDDHILIGINLAAGLNGTHISDNTITMTPSMRYPFGMNLHNYFQGHDTYGFGDKRIFGPVTSVEVHRNQLNHAVIRFADCCVQEDASQPDYRPFCQELNDLVKNRAVLENIIIANNSSNGQANMDGNLVWRVSRQERATAWYQSFVEKAEKNNGGIYCREYMDVRVLTANGVGN